MKKYFPGIFAIVLATIFSAFTHEKKTITWAWVYQSEMEMYIFDANYYYYEIVPECGGYGALPCYIKRFFIITPWELQEYLDSKSDLYDLLDDVGVESKGWQ